MHLKSHGAWAYLCNAMSAAHLLGCYVREGYAIIAFCPGPGEHPRFTGHKAFTTMPSLKVHSHLVLGTLVLSPLTSC